MMRLMSSMSSPGGWRTQHGDVAALCAAKDEGRDELEVGGLGCPHELTRGQRRLHARALNEEALDNDAEPTYTKPWRVGLDELSQRMGCAARGRAGWLRVEGAMHGGRSSG